MSRTFYSHPGRLTVNVRIPSELLDLVEQLAARCGAEPAVLLGDLVADELPEALADSARQLLRDPTPQDEARAP